MTVTESAIRWLPKAEVHVHFEGGFEIADLLELAGGKLPIPVERVFDPSAHVVAGDSPLSGFLRFLDWQCGLVVTAEQAARLAYRFVARQAASGVRYSDVIINPTHWGGWRGRVPALLDAIAAGFDDAEADGLGTANLAYSLLRGQSASEAGEIVDWIVGARPSRVIALSVDGDERTTGRTGEKFSAAFTRARDAGLRRTVHAGESSGPEGVWDALRLLHAERIDHGVRAIDDPALVEHLAQTGVPLDICPSSNLALGLYASASEHPVDKLSRAGVRVTINTDDPQPIGTRLEREWALVADTFGWDEARIVELARTSVDASFADDDRKRDLRAAIDAHVG